MFSNCALLMVEAGKEEFFCRNVSRPVSLTSTFFYYRIEEGEGNVDHWSSDSSLAKSFSASGLKALLVHTKGIGASGQLRKFVVSRGVRKGRKEAENPESFPPSSTRMPSRALGSACWPKVPSQCPGSFRPRICG